MFTLNIETSGAAFTIVSNDESNGTPAPFEETSRLLEVAALNVRAGYTAGTLTDVNGNRVGSWSITND